MQPPGFKVPDHYFEDFSRKMELLIDQKVASEKEPAPKISLWGRVKPWMYMAAMMASFVVLFRMVINPVANQEKAEIAQRAEEQTLMEDALYASISDYDLYQYLYPESE